MVGPLLRSLCSAAARKSFTSSSTSANYRKPYVLSRATGFTRHFSSNPAAATSPSTANAYNTVVDPSHLRNVAVIAHVDHGKTTLMDRLLRQCGADIPHERALDSISLERERGITIASKVTSISWKGNELNMVDTPGHADFGGEVERVVGMVEGAILVVDAGEGPLAQTKFVLAKALKYGLRPLLLLNKVDRPSVIEERCSEVESLVFDLFANLGATEEQLEFPVLYASAKEGWASSTYTKNPPDDARNMTELLDAIIRHVPPPNATLDAPFQMLVSMMEKDNYVGRILTGRIYSGVLQVGDKVHGIHSTDSGTAKIEEGKVVKLMKKIGTNIVSVDSAGAGDIVSMAGLTNPVIGHTISNVTVMTALPTVELDPPTISMTFGVNDSPLAGRDGTYLTGKQIGERLAAESERNLALNVIPGMSDSYEVQGRGELQLGILIENMRREKFELSVSPPKVMYKNENGQKLEPIEEVTIEVNEEHVGLVMEALSHRRGEITDMGPVPGSVGRTRLCLTCPSRGLVGYRSVFNSVTRGTGFMHRAFLTARFRSIFHPPTRAFVQFSLAHSAPSKASLEESIRAAVEAKAYQKIPELLNASRDSCRNPNPFTFLSKFSESQRFNAIDEMLQSFISIRPRSQPQKAYSCLLSLTLESADRRLPLALAIVQRMLRSGCLPAPQTHLSLSKAWLDRRQQQQAVSSILLEMNSIGYSPDCGTCNYLILSLCKIDHFAEAVEVLRGMGGAGCIPDLDSFGGLISEMSDARKVNEVAELVKEMVCVHLLNPRQETVVKTVDAMMANRELRRAVGMIEFLESEGVGVGFEAYESVLEGCLEVRQFVLAGKFVVRMTGRGFIPYLRVRQRLYEGLVGIGETELASVVRHRFAQLKS